MRCALCCSLGLPITAVAVAIALGHASPDFSNLPDFLMPHRPLPIVGLNFIGQLFTPWLQLRADSLIASACHAAALPAGAPCVMDVQDDPQPTAWREGLSALLDSYEHDANLTVLGRLIARGQTEQWLKTRSRLIHAWNALPPGALQSESISEPIFIVGLPRTGTTFLLNLLRQDPRLRTPLHWEYVEPIPADGMPLGPSHTDAVQSRLDQYMQLLPGLESMHPMEALMAEECVVSMAHEFTSLLHEATFAVSGYIEWLLQANRSYAHALRWHKRLLQFLQLRSRGSDSSEQSRQWVLKTPWFLGVLDELPRHYENLHIIHTHRAPADVIGSSASVHAKTYGAGSDHIDLHEIGSQQLSMMEVLLRRSLATRRAWSLEKTSAIRTSDRVVDVYLEDLKKDPIGEIERIYARLGLALPSEVRRSMESWLQQKQIYHGSHKFRLEDFGLTREKVMGHSAVFKEYCEAYSVHCD